MERIRRSLICLLVSVAASAALAQNAAPADEEDPMAGPSEYGIRLTPGIARAMSRQYVKHVMGPRYELPQDKMEDATELIARRMMQMAHKTEDSGQTLIEYAITQAMESEAESRGNGPAGLTPQIGQGIAERVLPVLPNIREFMGNVVQDVRPMLSLKQQLKLTGDAALAGMTLDSFEKNMQRWQTGDVKPFDNPFEPQNRQIQKGENGESPALQLARRRAQQMADQKDWPGWRKYVEEAKKFYGFDAPQSQAADSLLRECIERAAVAASDATLRDRVYRNRLWSEMVTQLPGGWNNPLRPLLEAEWENMYQPILAIGDELKDRIDQIPTQQQRDAAEARMTKVLADKGYAGAVPQTQPSAAAALTASGQPQ